MRQNVRDFDHIHSGKRTEIDNKQQPREQNKKLKIDNCMYFGAALSQRQCPAFGKHAVCEGSRTNFIVVCWSYRG